MVAVSIGGVCLRNYLLDRRPIAWHVFSHSVLNEHLQQGNPVLVFYSAPWSIESESIEQRVFETPDVRRAIRTNGVVPLRLAAPFNDFHSTADRAAVESLSSWRNPPPGTFVICRSEQPDDCIPFFVDATQEKVVAELNHAGRHMR